MVGAQGVLEATGAGSVSDGQWSLPFPTIAKIASAVSGILQWNNGVRKATGTFVYAIKSHYYYSWEIGSLD